MFDGFFRNEAFIESCEQDVHENQSSIYIKSLIKFKNY